MHFIYVRHFGSYNEVGPAFKKLIKYASAKKLPKYGLQTYGIVYDDPDLVEEQRIRYDACLKINSPATPSGEIGTKSIESGKYAVFRFKGDYKHFNDLYHTIYQKAIYDYQWEMRSQPTIEQYVKSPLFGKFGSRTTDIYLPIE